MRRTLRDILVGLTFLLGMGGVAALLLLFGEWSFGKPPSYRVVLQLDQVSGLTTASRVTLNGVVIGEIDSIAVSPDPRHGAVVTMYVREEVRIPRESVIVLERGLVGEATLLFRATPSESGSEAGYIGAEETVRAQALSVVDDLANAIESRLGALRGAADTFTRLANTYTEVGERAIDLMTPRSADTSPSDALPNIPQVIANLDGAIADARLWLGDESLRGDARSIATKAREAIERGTVLVEEWTRTARTVEQNAGRIGEETAAALQSFATTTRSLHETLAQVQEIAAKINRGEGTAGMLIHNPDLYRSLNDAAIRLERALSEAQLLIEKYRKEGVPIQF